MGSVRLFVASEREAGERRVALTPSVCAKLRALGVEILLEPGAGEEAGFPDRLYEGVELAARATALARADAVWCVQPPAAGAIAPMAEGSVLVGFLQPHRNADLVAALRDRKVISFAMELVPRISRAQAMDALSSQASAAGYRAALIAAQALPRFFPMLTTAAGTIRPAKVLVIGAGVAGLQAIATARRLGAIVEGYDVRSAAREQVESLGAKFVDTGVSAEAAGGYARELTEEERRQQRETLARYVAQADAVITTAAVPGRQAPRIIGKDMVEAMKPGSVVVDLAADAGGNCELTRPGEDVRHGGVLVCGPRNLPASLPCDASEMYARNLLNFFSPLLREGKLAIDWNDEVYRDSALTRDGQVVHAPTAALLQEKPK